MVKWLKPMCTISSYTRVSVSQPKSWMFTFGCTANPTTEQTSFSKDFTWACVPIFLTKSLYQRQIKLPRTDNRREPADLKRTHLITLNSCRHNQPKNRKDFSTNSGTTFKTEQTTTSHSLPVVSLGEAKFIQLW